MVELKLKFPDDFFKEEVRCGFTVSPEMKKVWAVELDLLQELLRVCVKYNLKLFASGGTLLGAIRHQGFIPWDDDIDMMMMRDEYEKLCKIAPSEFSAPYFFQTEYTDPGTLRGHAQLRNSETTGILFQEAGKRYFNQGIFIDIFPCDRVIDDSVKFEIQKKRAQKLLRRARRLSRFDSRYQDRSGNSLKNLSRRAVHLAVSAFKLEKRSYKKFEKTCEMYNDMNTEMISLLSFQFDNKAHYKYVEDFKEMHFVPFENIQMPIGLNSDRTLRIQYQDYMVMRQINNYHGTVFFDTNSSYRIYEPVGSKPIPKKW